MVDTTKLKKYETIYILNEDKIAKDFMSNIENYIIKQGGININTECWGRKKLAWQRKKNNYGVYVQHIYFGENNIVKKIEKLLDINEHIILRQSIQLKNLKKHEDIECQNTSKL